MDITIALASLPNHKLYDALAKAQQMDFSGVCLFGATGARHSQGLLSGFFWSELDESERDRLKSALEPFARNAIHAPFQDLPLISTNHYIEEEAMRQVLDSIAAAGALNLEVVTVHANRPHNIPMSEIMPRLVAKFRQLGDAASAAGTRIGVENVIYPTDPHEHIELLDAINHPAVGATLDVGHVSFWMKREGIAELHGKEGAAKYNEWLANLMDQLGKRIIHLHVHDVRLPDIRDHRAVGRGIIDFEVVIQKLTAMGYTGALEFELEEPDVDQAAVDSYKYLQALLDRQHQ